MQLLVLSYIKIKVSVKRARCPMRLDNIPHNPMS